MITLKNDFHNTEVRLIPKINKLSAYQVKKAKKVLCGIDGCICGNEAGMRGHNNPAVEFNQDWIDSIGGIRIKPIYIITGTILEPIDY